MFLPRQFLITVYKTLKRPHLDYGNINYDQTYNLSFPQKMESKQDNAALAITCPVRGTSREKLYQQLGLESLRKRQWYRKLCYLLKIFKY